MKDKIKDIIIRVEMTTIEPEEAVNKLFDLFVVSQQRELYCFECEIEMPTKVDNKSVLRCGNCGLKH